VRTTAWSAGEASCGTRWACSATQYREVLACCAWLDGRYRERGRVRTSVQLGAALATPKVTLGAVREGMSLAKVFSGAETFMAAHRASDAV